jgi:RNase P/RNase MRP subunit POP5
MLKRRSKRRYLSLLQADGSSDPANAIKKRFSELFGTIATEKADIRLIEQNGNGFIIRCATQQLQNILVAIALTDPPVITIDMSGTIRQLRRRRQDSEKRGSDSPQEV